MKTIVREKYDAAGNLIGKEVEHIYENPCPWYYQQQPVITTPAIPQWPYQVITYSSGCQTLSGSSGCMTFNAQEN